MTDDQTRQNTGRIDAPRFKFYPGKFITMTAGLSPSEVGGFVRLLCAIHVNGEAIVDDSKRLARRVGLRHAKAFDALRSTLLDAGLIEVRDGLLSSPLSQDVFANIAVADTHLRKNVSTKKAKIEKIQSRNPVEEEADTEVDAQAPSEPVQSHTFHTSDSDYAPAHDSAGCHTYRVDDPIEIPNIGRGWIDMIVGRRPMALIARYLTDGAFKAPFLLTMQSDGTFSCRSISNSEAEKLREKHSKGDHHAA